MFMFSKLKSEACFLLEPEICDFELQLIKEVSEFGTLFRCECTGASIFSSKVLRID